MATAQRTPVAVIDPREIMRRGICEILRHSEGYEVVFMADRPEAFLTCEEHRPRILIMDHPLRAGSACAIEFLHGHYPHLRILALARSGSPEGMRTTKRAGASGYLPCDAGAKDFVGALDAVRVQGEYYHPPYLAAWIAAEAKEDAIARLKRSPRLMETLRLMADPRELKDERIAQIMHLSVHTVRDNKKAIYAALGVHSRTGALLKAMAEGLLPPLAS